MTDHPIGLSRSLEGADAHQRAVVRSIEDGPRQGLPSPFLAMLDAPNLVEVIEKVGVTLRFAGTLTGAQREIAILATAGAVGCQYEWDYHRPIAESVGVTPSTIAAIPYSGVARPSPTDWTRETELIVTASQQCCLSRRMDDNVLKEIVLLLGRAKTTEIIVIAGYYSLLASFIIIGRHEEA